MQMYMGVGVITFPWWADAAENVEHDVPPRYHLTLQTSPMVVLDTSLMVVLRGGGLFLMSEVPLYYRGSHDIS